MAKIPTFKDIWSTYLFGSTKIPKAKDLLNPDLIRDTTVSPTIKISVSHFMEGAGRFVNGALFSVIRNFFDQKLSTDFLKQNSKNFQIDSNGNVVFDLKQISSLNEKFLGVNNYDNPALQKAVYQRQFFPNGESNYEFAKRVQLFESTNFQIGAIDTNNNSEYDKAIKFVIKPDGTRLIENFVITPKGKDNFDFIGGNGEQSEKDGNKINAFISDPSSIITDLTKNNIVSGIGRTVTFDYIEYDTYSKNVRKEYTAQDYQDDIQTLKNNNYIDSNSWLMEKRLLNILSGSLKMYKELYNEGIISFKDEEGRSVYYGTNHNDYLDLNSVNIIDFGVKVNSISLISPLSIPSFSPKSLLDIEEDRLDNFMFGLNNKNKITFVAGKGNDTIKGLNESGEYGNDRIFGNTGNDKLYGQMGDDILDGGEDDDELYGGDGKDSLKGGLGSDKLYGEKGFDIYFADNRDTIMDSDGLGEVFLDNVKLIGGVQDLTGKQKDLYKSEDGSITYRWNKETKELTVNDGLLIRDFDNGELGINLVEAKGQDIAFVIDTTGSMADDIKAVQNAANKIINMLFDPHKNMSASRVAIVGYNDPYTETFLKFTDHETIAERKQAALNGISKLYAENRAGNSDFPEMLYSGLLRALDGRAGEWNENATAQRIFVFGDAPAKDDNLASQVYRLANAMGVQTRSIESQALSRSVNKTNVEFQATENSKIKKVEIFTILIGNDNETAANFTEIANTTGGSTFTANGADDIVNVLFDALQSGTDGDDIQIGNEFNNTFNGRLGDDKLYGHAGDDTLNGGAGNDLLVGGEGADTFIFSQFFGKDTVLSDKLDTFVFNGITLSSLAFVQNEDDLLIQQKGTENDITVTGFFNGTSSFDLLKDDLGNTLSAEQVAQLVQQKPITDKNQTISGNIFSNYLVGGSGNDTLYGKAGKDTLKGGLGDDRLEGGIGQDTYLFQAGDGNDTIYDSSGNDTLKFENTALGRLWFSREGRNLKIDVLDGGGSVTIENQYLNTKSNHLGINAVEHFQAGKYRLPVASVKALLNVMEKFAPTDSADLNADAQKYEYLQSVNIEQYWYNTNTTEQY